MHLPLPSSKDKEDIAVREEFEKILTELQSRGAEKKDVRDLASRLFDMGYDYYNEGPYASYRDKDD